MIMSIFKRIAQWFKPNNKTDKESRDEYRKLLLDLYSIAIDAIMKKNATLDNFVFSIIPVDYRFSINVRHVNSKYSKTVHVNGMVYAKLTTNDKFSYIENILQKLVFETKADIKKERLSYDYIRF